MSYDILMAMLIRTYKRITVAGRKGKLMYIMVGSRPGIAYTVSVVSKFNPNLIAGHL